MMPILKTNVHDLGGRIRLLKFHCFLRWWVLFWLDIFVWSPSFISSSDMFEYLSLSFAKMFELKLHVSICMCPLTFRTRLQTINKFFCRNIVITNHETLKNWNQKTQICVMSLLLGTELIRLETNTITTFGL